MGEYHEISAPVLKTFRITAIKHRAATVQMMTLLDKDFIFIMKVYYLDSLTPRCVGEGVS
jgi:hypothetical protein